MADVRYRVVYQWTAPQGVIMENILHEQITDPELTPIDDLLDDFAARAADIFTALLGELATNIALTLLKVYVLDVITGALTPLGQRTLSLTGTNVGQFLPHGIAPKINFFVPLRPRPFGPYLPPPTAGGMTSEGLIGAAYITAALNVGAQATTSFVGPTSGLTFRPVGWASGTNDIISLAGSDVEVDNIPDYQRRRKPGVGI